MTTSDAETAITLAYRHIVGARVTAAVPVAGVPTLVLSSGHRLRFEGFPTIEPLLPMTGSTIVGVVPGGHTDIVAIVFQSETLERPITIEVLAKPLAIALESSGVYSGA